MGYQSYTDDWSPITYLSTNEYDPYEKFGSARPSLVIYKL